MKAHPLAKGVFPRIQQKGLLNAFIFSTARFQPIRATGNTILNLTQPKSHEARKRMLRPRSATKHSIFQGIDPESVIAAIHQRSWFPQFNLTSELVDDIIAEAKDCPLVSRLQPNLAFHLRDKRKIERQIGRRIVFAKYKDMAVNSRALATVCSDPLLLITATKYLGRTPRRVVPRLVISFVAETSAKDRLEQGQTTDFHFDVNGFRELFFNFYLTDTDENSGAHVVVEGSHGEKHWRHLLGSVNVSDDDLTELYPNARITTVCGNRGFGFVEDPYCIHKALPPRSRYRLFLQVRCS
jgi:hypothetical protein